MMKTLKTAFAALVLGSSMAQAVDLPAGVTQDDVDAFIAAMLKIGCKIQSDAQAAQVEGQTGYDDDMLESIVIYLLEQGQLTSVKAGNGIRLINEACN